MNNPNVTEQTQDAASGSLHGVVLRQWCVDKAIDFCKPVSEAQTADLMDCATRIERYVTTGKHAPLIEVGLLIDVMHEAETATLGVGPAKVKAVCAYIAERCDLPQNNVLGGLVATKKDTNALDETT